MWVFIILFLTTVYILFLLLNQPSSQGLPPGPQGLPLVGNLFDLWKEEPMKYYSKKAEKHGPIYSIQLGKERVLVLSSAYWLKKCFSYKGVAFSGRPRGILLSYITNGKGIVMSDDDLNSQARRVLLHSFKNFGFGENNIEHYIDGELRSFMQNIKENHEMEKYDPQFDLSVSVLNVTWRMLSGEAFQLEDRTMKWITKTVGFSLDLVKFGGFESYTYLLQVITTFCRPKSILVGFSMLLRFLMFHRSIKTHRMTINEKPRSDDFIYSFLEEQKKYKHNPEMKLKFSDSQLKWILSDIFIAAIETSVTVIRWALIMASEHPRVQQTLYDEIESIIGRDRKPRLSDKEDMPYMEAFISEVLRRRTPIPLLMHSTSKDVFVDQFKIPKDTWVIANLWGIHMNKEIWGDPENFRPSRFLDGKKYRKSENLVPFSVGRRCCIGEPLAMAEVFLFLANIFQKYRVEKFDQNFGAEIVEKVTLTNSPKNSVLKFIPRF